MKNPLPDVLLYAINPLEWAAVEDVWLFGF